MKCCLVSGQEIKDLKFSERLIPEIGEYDVLVEVQAVSLNFRDVLVALGKYDSKQYPPFIAGSDMAGTVKQVGNKVSLFKPGDRVINAPFRFWPAGKLCSEWAKTFIGGSGVDGVLAEFIAYPEQSLVSMPEHLTFPEASTLTIAGLTAWSGVVVHGKTRPGEWVLLHGTGGVSIFGAQLAKTLGALTIMTTSNVEKAKLVKNTVDINHFVDYRDPNWVENVRKITGNKGVDVVLDVAGGETLSNSLKACNYNARVSLVGLLNGTESKISVPDMLYHQVTIRGIFMESTEELKAFAKAIEVNKIVPYVDKVFSFDELHQAYDYMASQKHVGKVVIAMK